MNTARVRRKQIDKMFESFKIRSRGPWIRDIRESLRMSLEDLALRMDTIKQRVSKLEKDEALGKVTVESLRRAAEAMDCEFVYFFRPKQGLEKTYWTQLEKALREVVDRVDQTMSLENQKTTKGASLELFKEKFKEELSKNTMKIWKHEP